MKFKSISLFFIVGFLCLNCVWAQNQNPSAGDRVTTEDLKELVETLESETARKALLSDLKALLKVQEQQAAQQAAAGGKGSFKAQLERMKQEYHALLGKYGLDSSLLGRIMVSIAACGIALLLMLLVRMSATFVQEKLHGLKSRFALDHGRFEVYIKLLRYIGYGLSACLLLYVLSLAWEVTDFEFLGEGSAGPVLTALMHIVLILAVATALWEVLNTLIEQAMRRADGSSGNRMRTLLPIARNFLLLVLICLFTLVILSEVGVDIMPLLAGAGIFGIAIGFGAQTFVKDLLTGFTIIFEDLIQVGDVIKVGGHTGAVERITIRKIQLRDLSGIVYTVPFSEISTVENRTKNFSYHVIDIAIAYSENPDSVIACLREIGESLRKEDPYQRYILEPIEILGIERFEDSAVVIRARIKTLPAKQWDIGREFNRRIKYKFDERRIEIPFPSQTIYFGDARDGGASPLHVLLQRQDTQAGD
jgi:small-conductance mechanosensitive channel